MDQEPQEQHSGAGEIDLNSILLPKKKAPSVDSAQRIDAGSLLAQEQAAGVQMPEATNATQPGSAPASPNPVAAEAPVKQTEGVQPLQTYQGDIAGVLQGGRVSIVSIAAAEATRRSDQTLNTPPPPAQESEGHPLRTAVFIFIGLLLIGASLGAVVWYAFFYNAPLSTQTMEATPFIQADNIQLVSIPKGENAAGVMQQLTAAKDSVSLSLGLVAQLYIVNAPTSTDMQPTYVTTQQLLTSLAATIPDTLVRNFAPVYLLGVHSFAANQPFLILKVDSYEQAYAGMLAWETTMYKDLSPLFVYTPALKSQNSQTSSQGTTTAEVFVPTGFVDKIVNNHDARVLQNAEGNVYFLWTFLDRSTIVITTNADTLREVITRLIEAPVTTLPTK